VTDRITRETVTFVHPFELADVEGMLPAGTYTVETIEEPIEGVSMLAYRRVSTTIIVPSPRYGMASRQMVTIDPLYLEAARKKDAERSA
jgi:hypothetical protein